MVIINTDENVIKSLEMVNEILSDILIELRKKNIPKINVLDDLEEGYEEW